MFLLFRRLCGMYLGGLVCSSCNFWAGLEAHLGAARKLLGAVDEVAVGGVHLVLECADVALHHAVHRGVEVANPRQLHTLIRVLCGADILFEHSLHYARLDTLALKLGRDAEDNAKDAVATLAHL